MSSIIATAFSMGCLLKRTPKPVKRQRILVLGNHGQLASAIRAIDDGSYDLHYAGRYECDLRETNQIARFLEATSPAGVINTAAYTAVDDAEDDPSDAVLINGLAVRVVADYCRTHEIPLVHVSSDYVLDGEKGAPYLETDPCYPRSLYGFTKLLGERAVQASGVRSVTLRTAWVFSAMGRNFALTMMALAASRDVVRVVDDQYGNPTSALLLARACVASLTRLLYDPSYGGGLYNFGGGPSASWADLAEEVFVALELNGLKRPRLERIATAEYPTRARRPIDSRMDTSKFEADFPGLIGSWKPAVREEVAKAVAFARAHVARPA